MLVRPLLPLLPLVLGMNVHGEPRSFTDSSGRTLVAELQSADEDKITIRRKDGKVFTIPLESLAENDQAYAREWRKNQTARESGKKAAEQAVARREKIAEFCRSHHRKQVGNGECWTLADEAFKASGTIRPGADLRVWGRLVDIADEPIEPGDIVEFRAAEIPGYGITGEKHTAVVIKGGRRGKCTLAEQNWGEMKTVRHIAVNLSASTSGSVMVYRPE